MPKYVFKGEKLHIQEDLTDPIEKVKQRARKEGTIKLTTLSTEEKDKLLLALAKRQGLPLE